MLRAPAFAILLLALGAPARPAGDQLAEARRLYNSGQYAAAETAANEALHNSSTANGARLVLGRIRLERFRQSADAADLAAAREALRGVDARSLDARDRVELAVGIGEALYFEDRFGAAAELFESVLGASSVLGAAGHERVLDWWATTLDKLAQTQPPEERGAVYERIAERMVAEIATDSGSTPGGYWLVAAERGRGDLDRAYSTATAAWVRAPFARDHGAALRADVNRLMVQAIIPERAAHLQPSDRRQALTSMLNEWEAFKAGWSK